MDQLKQHGLEHHKLFDAKTDLIYKRKAGQISEATYQRKMEACDAAYREWEIKADAIDFWCPR